MRARLSMLYGQQGHSHPPPLVMPHPAAGRLNYSLIVVAASDVVRRYLYIRGLLLANFCNGTNQAALYKLVSLLPKVY